MCTRNPFIRVGAISPLVTLETRSVFAILGVVFLTVGTLLHASERTGPGLLCLTVGFVFAGCWAFLGMSLAQRGEATTPAETYLSGGMAALTLTVYFGMRTHETLFSRRTE